MTKRCVTIPIFFVFLVLKLGIAQGQTMKITEYRTQLIDWGERKAAAELEIAKCDEEISSLGAEVRAVQAQIFSVWQEIYSAIGVTENDVNAFRASLNDIETQLNVLASLAPQELLASKVKLDSIEFRITQIESDRITALSEMRDKIAGLGGKVVQLRARIDTNVSVEADTETGPTEREVMIFRKSLDDLAALIVAISDSTSDELQDRRGLLQEYQATLQEMKKSRIAELTEMRSKIVALEAQIARLLLDIKPTTSNDSTGRKPNVFHAKIDSIRQSMQWADSDLIAPNQMDKNETRTIRFIINPLRLPETLEDTLVAKSTNAKDVKPAAEPAGTDTVIRESVQIWHRMKANLQGSEGLIIKPIGSEERVVYLTRTTEWTWKVTAREAGVQWLALNLVAMVSIGGEPAVSHDIITHEKTIQVQVSFWARISGFVEAKWEWLWTALLIPIFTWFAKRKKKA